MSWIDNEAEADVPEIRKRHILQAEFDLSNIKSTERVLSGGEKIEKKIDIFCKHGIITFNSRMFY